MAFIPSYTATPTLQSIFDVYGNYDPPSLTFSLLDALPTSSIVITWATPQTYNASTHPATAVVNGVGGATEESTAEILSYPIVQSPALAGTGKSMEPTKAGTYRVRIAFASSSH